MTDAAEQTASQRRATAVLGDLLDQAARDGLPVLLWTVHNAGTYLIGRSLASPSHVRRGDLQSWADTLGIGLHEHKWESGGSSLTGSAERHDTRHGVCTIALVADVYADDGEDAEGDHIVHHVRDPEGDEAAHG